MAMKSSTSKFSATMIGVHERDDPKGEAARKIYCDEAQVIAKVMGGVHHSRKLGHQQVFYPETVQKLENSHIPQQYNRTAVYEAREMMVQDFQQKFTEHIKNERFINDRKRNYNREVGRKAVVNQVIAGTAPMPKYSLFPQGATHNQILALTNSLKAPDANIIPPAVPRLRKWRGDNVGWGAQT